MVAGSNPARGTIFMLNIIIFGSPGSGKGTQAELISQKYKLSHLSSGELLRQELKNGILGEKIKKYQNAGKLVPDNIIISMMETAIRKKINGSGFIFDGYPRNLKQAKNLDKFLIKNNLPLSLVIDLKLNQKEALSRIIQRGKTSGRSDDNVKTITNRFKTYKIQTKPILEYYKNQKKVISIDGQPAIKDIFEKIKTIIDSI